MVDPAARADRPSDPPTRRSALRTILRIVLFTVGVGLPGLITAGGLVLIGVSFFQPAGQNRDDLFSSGLVYLIGGGIWLGVGAYFFFRRRRRSRHDPAHAFEDAILTASDASPLPADLDAVFGPPIVPPPTTVILPYALSSKPWQVGRPWWLAPIVLVVMGVSVVIRAHGSGGTIWAALAISLALAAAVGALQLAYLYRRRIVVDDLNVSSWDMFGRATTVARGDIGRIALRTLIGKYTHEDRLFMLGRDGQCLLRIARFGLSYEEAVQLAAVLRVPIDRTWDRPATIAEMRKEIPGSATWAERHRLLFGLAIMIPCMTFAALLTLARDGLR
jgi:hypothetical protein